MVFQQVFRLHDRPKVAVRALRDAFAQADVRMYRAEHSSSEVVLNMHSIAFNRARDDDTIVCKGVQALAALE